MRYLTMNSVGQMEDHYMPMRYRTAGGGDDANSHGHAHAMSSTMAGIKRTAEEAGISSHQQHHHQQQQQYMCDSNGMKQNAMSMANSSQSVMSNSPVPGATGVSQVQDPQPSTSHPTDQKPGLPNGKKTKGRVKIKMEFIDNKLRRYTTFSKRKTGIMKKAYELSTLTGTQVMLLVASETGHVYTFATRKLQPMITSDTGKDLIQMCLNSPDPPADPRCQVNDPRGQPSGFEETDLSYSVDDEKEQQRLAYHAASAMEEDMAGDDDEGSPIAVDDNGDDEESGGEEEYGSPASFHEGSSTHSDVKPFIRKMHMQQPKRFNGNYRRNYHVDDEEAVLGKRTVEVKKAPPGLLPIAGKSAANAAEQKRGRGNSEQKAMRGDVSGVPENFSNGPGASYLIQTPQGFIFNNGNLGRDHFLHTDLTGTAASIASTLPEGTCIMRKDRMSEGMSKRK